jgi:hypothetical protein
MILAPRDFSASMALLCTLTRKNTRRLELLDAQITEVGNRLDMWYENLAKVAMPVYTLACLFEGGSISEF